MITSVGIDSITSMIQLSVAPVFLLAGVAGILNLFSTRLIRIIDKVDRLDKFEQEQKSLNNMSNDLKNMIKNRRDFLTMRMNNTNLAIFLEQQLDF